MPTRKEDEKQDRALRDSFPASDPPASSGITGPRATPAPAEGSEEAGEDDRPKGRPTDDRYQTETAHHSEKSDGQ